MDGRRLGQSYFAGSSPCQRALAFVHFLLPDGNDLFQLVDQEAAGVERLSAVCAADGNHHAWFSHGHSANPVPHGQALYRPPGSGECCEFLHLGDCHFRIRLVIQSQEWAGLRMVLGARGADEYINAARLRSADGGDRRRRMEGFRGQSYAVTGRLRHGSSYPPLTGGMIATSSPSFNSGFASSARPTYSWLIAHIT